MENATSIKSIASFDCLPPEIILLIFDYLSTNDIIDTFFDFSQRLKNLLLENQRYLSYFELPTTNLNKWRKLLPMIGSQIQCLNINRTYLSLSLEYFPNLKSIIISSQHGLADEEFTYIINSEQFQRLESFKIKENQRPPTLCPDHSNGDSFYHNEILIKVFNNKTLLKIFQYSLILPKFEWINFHNFKSNDRLQSLTLILQDYHSIFSFIKFTPKLKYLNVRTRSCYRFQIPTNKIEINLKEFHLKLGIYYQPIRGISWPIESVDLHLLTTSINLFSSSLICLSLDLTEASEKSTDEFIFNSLKFQQFLEPMKQLKQFHLYARIFNDKVTNNFILTKFRKQFWFDHNWSFGMHGKYLYTLPFHFHYLYDFPNNFNDIQSNNNELVRNNPRLWYNVKSLELSLKYPYHINFVKELKIKMPKLNFITFMEFSGPCKCKTQVQYSSNDERDKIDETLEKLTIIQLIDLHIKDINKWLINSLPNLKYLILSGKEFCSIDNQLPQILNERIEELDINDDFNLEDLTKLNNVYISNVKYINFCLIRIGKSSKEYADIIMKILKIFKNLKILLIYIYDWLQDGRIYCCTNFFEEILQYLNINDNYIMKNYELKHYREYYLFCKREFDENEIDETTLSM